MKYVRVRMFYQFLLKSSKFNILKKDITVSAMEIIAGLNYGKFIFLQIILPAKVSHVLACVKYPVFY
jgi:hypothetical protein